MRNESIPINITMRGRRMSDIMPKGRENTMLKNGMIDTRIPICIFV